MTRWTLVLRTLKYFRAANIAVAAGVAVACAVLTGALMVGDSVQISLQEFAAHRLGRVDYAMSGPRLVEQSLAQRISQQPDFQNIAAACVPAIFVTGGASTEDRRLRTSGVEIIGVGGDWFDLKPGQCQINGELADALGIDRSGVTLLLPVPQLQAMPRDIVLARRSRSETTNTLRVQVVAIARGSGMAAAFDLQGGQRVPRIAWVNMEDLADFVGQEGHANAIFVTAGSSPHAQKDTAALNALLHGALTLGDVGLSLTANGNDAILNSMGTYLSDAVVNAAEAAARAQHCTPRLVCANLVNTAAKIPAAGDSGEKSTAIHYALAVGISSLDDTPLAADDIALNEWAAQHLSAQIGDRISLSFYQRQPNGDLTDVPCDQVFRVARILPMTGLGADPTLTPSYHGLTDSPSMDQWDAPKGITIHKQWITPDDEKYWHEHRAAPKIFLNLDAARRLWGGAYGDITSIRIPADKSAKFAADLLAELDPAAVGLSFTAIKAKQIAASSSGGEFAMTFVAFSFFLIAAAVLLTAMLFALSVEQRARQLGLLQATGFSPRRLRRMVLAEGMLVALAGSLVGGAAAVGYTGLMMLGLRTRWIGAVGTTQLHLHVEPMTLIGGIVATLVIAWVAMLWGVWRIGHAQPARLLAGQWGGDETVRRRSSRVAYAIASAAAVLGVALLALGKWRMLAEQEAFLGGGALFLVAALSALAGWLRRGGRAVVDSLGSLALRNAARKPSRSLLTAALIACATFILTIVAGMRQQGPLDVADPHSGAGGFRLMLRAGIPLLGDLATSNGRELLGITHNEAALWSQAKFISLRRWAGQDVSCLNMTRPTDPTILAVPQTLIDRSAFRFAAQVQPVANPWTLLERMAAPNQPVPIIADANTAAYILQIGLGDQLTLHDADGAPHQARLVATLAGSIFQGELLMGQANFRRLYPDQSGFGVVLIDVPASQVDAMQKRLNTELDVYAVGVDETSKVLAMYDQVANTYLATFQTLGSMGLLLGVLGLAVVLLRAMAERRSELAMLGAIGLSRGQKTWLVLAENLFLLAVGLVIGLASALLAVAPAVVGSGQHIGWTGLASALAAVTATAVVALVLAVGWGSARITAADLQGA